MIFIVIIISIIISIISHYSLWRMNLLASLFVQHIFSKEINDM